MISDLKPRVQGENEVLLLSVTQVGGHRLQPPQQAGRGSEPRPPAPRPLLRPGALRSQADGRAGGVRPDRFSERRKEGPSEAWIPFLLLTPQKVNGKAAGRAARDFLVRCVGDELGSRPPLRKGGWGEGQNAPVPTQPGHADVSPV